MSYRMPPCASTGSQIPPTRVPLCVSQGIVVGSTQMLNSTAPLVLRPFAFASVFVVEI